MGEFTGTERYQVTGRLGQGGMGAVYEAFDRRRERKVAVKVLRDPERGSLFRFKREFRAVADLRHPNLVRLYDLGVLPGGTFFFTMERVLGVDLTSWCRKRAVSPLCPAGDTMLLQPGTVLGGEPDDGAPPREDLARVMLGILDGLEFLHRARKVHRDLKPQNVLVEESGRPRLLDFGILADLDDRGTGLTIEGAMGTPYYMAPEQVLGEGIGPATDLYALGCLLYEALTGNPPFTGPAARVLMRHVREEPVPPSEVRPCDPALERACLSLLRKDPGERPDAETLRETLAELSGAASSTRHVAPLPAAPGLLGREPELARLSSAWAEAERAPRILLVSGESGSGKSALVAELAQQVQERGARAWLGPCYEHEQVPYKAFDPLLDAVALALVERREDAARLLPAGAPSLLRLFPVLREVPCVASLEPDTTVRDARAERERAFRALLLLLTNLADGRPPLIVLDDLQRSDAESLEVLHWMTRASELPPCLVLGTYRSEEADAAPGLLGLLEQGERVSRLALGPLPFEALVRLVGAWAPALTPGGREALARDAAGNPFLAVELARVAGSDAGAAAPSITSLVARRVAPLGPAERAALDVAAAAGGRVGFALLARAAGLGPAALSDALDELQRVHLLREAPGALGDDAYGLGHDRLREAVYAAVDPARRRELHRILAEQLMSDGDASRAVAHWRLADQPGRAREAALAAAGTAETKLAFDQAAELYLLAVGPGADASLLPARASALAKAGRHREAGLVYREAADATQAASEQRELRLLAARELLAAADFEAGLAQLELLLFGVGDRLYRTNTRCYVGIVWRVLVVMLLWRFRDLTEWWQGGRCPRPAPDPETEFQIRLYQTAHHHLAVPRPILSVGFGVKHEMLVHRHEVPGQEGLARIGHAFLLVGAFGPAVRRRVLHHLYRGEALCHQAGETRGAVYGQAVRGYLAMLRADWAGVTRATERADLLARRGGLHGEPTLALLRSMRVGAEFFAGELPRAIASAERYLAEARSRGSVGELARLLAIQGSAWVLQGERELAARALEEAMRQAPVRPISLIRIQVELMAAPLHLLDERPEECLRALEASRARWNEHEMVVTDMETALYAVHEELARLQLLRLGRPAPQRRVGFGRGFSVSTTVREVWMRVCAAAAFQAGKPWKALRLLERSLRSSELNGSRLAVALATAGRGKLRQVLGLPGAERDREEAQELLAALGVKRCYLMKVEGWED